MTTFTPPMCDCGGPTRRTYTLTDPARYLWRCTVCGCRVDDAPAAPTVHRRRELGSFRFMDLFSDGCYTFAVQIHKRGVLLTGYAPGLPLPDVEEALPFIEYPELYALVRWSECGREPVAMNDAECQNLVSGLDPQGAIQ